MALLMQCPSLLLTNTVSRALAAFAPETYHIQFHVVLYTITVTVWSHLAKIIKRVF